MKKILALAVYVAFLLVPAANAAEAPCSTVPAKPGCNIPSPVGIGPAPGAPSGVSGVDLSIYQGYPNFVEAKKAGLKWAYNQVGDGLSYSDANFDANWRTERRLGIKHGAYLFLRPESAIAQADKLAIAIKQAGGHGGDLLAPAIDAEVPGVYSLVCPIVHRLQTDLKSYYRTKHLPVIVYTSPGLWPGGKRCGKLWVADYGVSTPIAASSWSTWTAWQYTSIGSVPGIVGSVDMDHENGILGLIHKIKKPSRRKQELQADIRRHNCHGTVRPSRYKSLCKRWIREYAK